MLSTGRVSIVGFCVANLSKAVPIAVRYSAVRKQFGTPNKELPVLEYQLQVCYRKYVLGNKLIICSYKKDNIITITTIFHLYWLVITAVFVILFRHSAQVVISFAVTYLFPIQKTSMIHLTQLVTIVSKSVHTWVLPPIKTIAIRCSKIIYICLVSKGYLVSYTSLLSPYLRIAYSVRSLMPWNHALFVSQPL